MMRFLDSKKFRVLISLCVLFVVGLITTIVSFSNTYDWVETDVDKLYKRLLTQNDELINSDTYLVTDTLISRIEPDTTIEEFTANINRDDFILTFNNVKVNEGLVKTGMVLTRGEENYTLVVAGDLNKDGLMTTIDTSMMIDNTKVVPTDNLVKLANDFNEDGKLDKTDVDNSVDYILNDKIELKETNTDVRATSLEIVSGDLGNNNWYRGDIVVKIGTNGAKDTSYKVIGTSIQEGVGISDGAEVTLSGYGAYKIIAWNYNEEGIRSNVTTMTFKIDDREIVPTVTYSTTEPTSKKVVATVSFNKENVFVSNNNKNNDYTFYKNGEFEYEYLDVTGRTGKIKASVSWMEDAVGADGQWRYTLVDDDEIYLREYLLKDYSTAGENPGYDFVIPTEYDGYKVYGVGNNVARKNIFGFDENVYYEENYGDSFSFESIKFPDDLKEIGDYAFYSVGKVQEDLVIPDNVSRIGDNAFAQYMGQTFNGELTLGKNLEYIGNCAFYNNYFEGDLVLPENVKSVENYAFSGTTFTGNLTLNENLEQIGDGAFEYNNFVGDLVIPDNVAYIGESAFRENGFNGTLTLGKNLKTIGEYVFFGNSFTGDLLIPDSVTTIGQLAFYGSKFNGNLTIGNGLTNIAGSVFSSNAFTGNLIIPDSVTNIDSAAFSNNKFNGTLTLSKNLTRIGGAAFSGNNFVGDLKIPNAVTELAEAAFYMSGFNGTLTLGSGLTTIRSGAFDSNAFTGDLIIPDNVTSISEGAFTNNKFNGDFVIGDGIKYLSNGVFSGNKFTGDLVIGDGITEIPDSLFRGVGFTGTLTLGKNVKSINSFAFYENSFTGTLIIPDSVETIGTFAFAQNKFSGDIVMGQKVKSVSEGAFYQIVDLTGTVDVTNITDFNSTAFDGTQVVVINNNS